MASTYKVNFNGNTEIKKAGTYVRIYAVIHIAGVVKGIRRVKFPVINLTTQKSFCIKEEYWNSEAQRCLTTKGSNAEKTECRQANRMMNLISSAVDAIVNDYVLRDITITPALLSREFIYDKVKEMNNFTETPTDDFIDEIAELLEEEHLTFSAYWQVYINNAKSGNQRNTNTGKRYAPRTIIAEQKCLNTFLKFERAKHKKYEFEEIDKHFYGLYSTYLERCNYQVNTIGEQFKHIKHIMREAYRNKLHNNTAFEDFKIQEEEVDNVYLTEEEIQMIADLDLTDEKVAFLDKYRDVFLIGCYSGLRVSDLLRLSKKNKYEADGVKMLKVRTIKTSTEVVIPIIWEDLEYRLEKYDYDLPPMTEQKLGKYCKQVAKMAGIDSPVYITSGKFARDKVYQKWELISPHTCRRSACTNMIKNGIPPLMVMKISGHKKEKTFLNYVKISEEENALLVAKLFAKSRKEKEV